MASRGEQEISVGETVNPALPKTRQHSERKKRGGNEMRIRRPNGQYQGGRAGREVERHT
jgi:hypothetical protein